MCIRDSCPAVPQDLDTAVLQRVHVHLRGPQGIPAMNQIDLSAQLGQVECVRHSGIQILWNSRAVGLLRDKRVSGLVLEDVRTGARRELACEGIFVAVSYTHLILDRGGTILFTARSEEFINEGGRKKAVATCKLLGLDGIVAIGGDGTFRGALELSRMGIPVVGIPATIDNDIGCSNYTIGFDTACNTAIECIDKLRDTMQSHERCSVVEVMGRHAGYLALYVGIAVGATAVLIPERDVDFEKDVVERIRESRLAGNTHFMIVVAEGAGSAVEDVYKRQGRDRGPNAQRLLP